MKEEILNKIRSAGALNNFDRHEAAWKEAFDLFAQQTGTRLSMKCGKCFQTVKEWLQKP